MKAPKYLYVVLKDGTTRRYNYDNIDFKFTNEYFTVADAESSIVRFTTPRENLMYYECTDCEYYNRVWREDDGNESAGD